MKTFMANAGNIQREWYIVDAAGMPLGRVASQVAAVLRGKHKPTFTPNADAGDHVIVINTDKLVLTGHKLGEVKRHHSGHPGGFKEIGMKKLMAEKSEYVLYEAVRGMLPKNSLGRKMIKKLRVYGGSEHAHIAQQPKELPLVKKSYQQ